jgi:hypothetical protein
MDESTAFFCSTIPGFGFSKEIKSFDEFMSNLISYKDKLIIDISYKKKS